MKNKQPFRKSTLFWLAMSTLPMMGIAKFGWGVYLMCAFGIIFITLWLTYPKGEV